MVFPAFCFYTLILERTQEAKVAFCLPYPLDTLLIFLGMSRGDFEKIKAILRAETAVAKIHSHVAVMPPLHLFYTSNQRLQNHGIRVPSLFVAEVGEKRSDRSKRSVLILNALTV